MKFTMQINYTPGHGMSGTIECGCVRLFGLRLVGKCMVDDEMRTETSCYN